MSSDGVELGSEQLRGLFEELSESLRERNHQAQLRFRSVSGHG